MCNQDNKVGRSSPGKLKDLKSLFFLKNYVNFSVL